MISVCVTTYNGEKYIKEQLDSIVCQLNDNDEIIISDDGSTDKTLAIAKTIDFPNIRIIHHTKENGYTANFEFAISHAKGDFIFLSDQDDVWVQEKVKVCMQLLTLYDMVVSDAIITDQNLNHIDDSFFSSRGVYSSLLGNIYKFGYLGCCMALKRSILKKALPFPKNRLFCTHDNWLFLVSKCYFHTYITPQKLVLYRRHQDTVSTGSINKHEPLSFRIKYRLYLIYHLIIIGLR